MSRTRSDQVALYKQIYNQLHQEIGEGLYDAARDQLLPSENALSRRFGVERSTVRKALQLLADDGLIKRIPGVGTKLIRTDASERAESGQPMQPEQPLSLKQPETRRNQTFLLVTEQDSALVIHEDHYHFRLLQEFERRISAKGHHLMFKSLGRGQRLLSVLEQIAPEAVIFVGHMEEQRYQDVCLTGLPCISVDYFTPLITSVVINNFDSAYLVIKMLNDRGHHKIGIVTGGLSYQSSIERYDGVLQRYQHNKEKLDNRYIIHGDYQFDSGFAAGEKFLAMEPGDRPTAVFAFNDYMAYGCYSCFERYHVKVPDEISIVGFDLTERFTLAFGHITTVDVNITSIADYACWYLFTHLSGEAPEVNAKIQLSTTIVDYGTVCYRNAE